MKINRIELLQALDAVQPGLATKELIEQSQSFVFSNGSVITYNDEISVSHPIAIDIEGAVKAKELYDLLMRIKQDEIEIEMKKNELRIKSKRTKAGITLEAEINMPLDKMDPVGKWRKLPKNFCEALRFCAFTASQESNKPALTCLLVDGRYVLSCDGFRFTRYDMGEDVDVKHQLMIPAKASASLVNYEPIKYNASGAWIHFKTKQGSIFSCKTFEEKYPNIDHLLKIKGTKIKMPKNLIDILARAEVFSKSENITDASVDITVTKNLLMVSTRNESGWLKESAKIKYDGDEVTFSINPDFFKVSIKLLNDIVVGDNTMKLKGKNFIHVVCLIAQN